MGARTKVNAAYTNGVLLVASAIGLSFNSWTAFFITAGVLIALHTASGAIRSST